MWSPRGKPPIYRCCAIFFSRKDGDLRDIQVDLDTGEGYMPGISLLIGGDGWYVATPNPPPRNAG